MPSYYRHRFATINEGLTLLEQSIILNEMAKKSHETLKLEVKAAIGRIENNCIGDAMEVPGHSGYQIREQFKTWWRLIETNDTYYIARIVDAASKGQAKTGADPTLLENIEVMLDLLGDYTRSSSNISECSTQYRTLSSDIGKLAVTNKDPKSLIGTYAHFNTGRRYASGWIEGGRGNTVHIRVDQWGISSYEPEKYLETIPFEKFMWMDPSKTQTMTFRMDNSDPQILLPFSRALARKLSINMQVTDMHTSKVTADTLWKKRITWEGAGGKRAAQRRDAITKVTEDAQGDPMERQKHGLGAEAKFWLQAALQQANDLEAVRQLVVDARVKSVGGALSEAEKTLIADEPTDIPEDFNALWRKEWDKLRNPEPKKEEVTE